MLPFGTVGIMTFLCIEAAAILEEKSINGGSCSITSDKPIDKEFNY